MPSFFTPEERRFASVVSRLSHCNHFLPERIALEREALGDLFQPHDAEWNLGFTRGEEHPNVRRLEERTAEILRAALARTRTKRTSLPPADRVLYEDLVAYHLYRLHRPGFIRIAGGGSDASTAFFHEFSEDLGRLLQPARAQPATPNEAALAFALLFQIERAFQGIFHHLVGSSPAIARLRAAVWQSIFTHDLHRYRRGLFHRMSGLTTLITGPSGTGKELVARTIAQSAFIEFDPVRRRFLREPAALFLPLNLAALAPTLIESELFGHRRGAFTGATSDRAGWLEACPPEGTVFLDEIGETSPAIQVKLLRVLQSRTFQRLGESQARRFPGKIIAATNRDLPVELQEGRLRSDFYYRLCSDLIVTPSLSDQLREAPGDLPRLVRFIARDLCDPEEADRLTEEVVAWIGGHLPADYPWPGNFRELEQCTRNILVRGHYEPLARPAGDDAADLAAAIRAGNLTAAQLLERYCTLVHARTGNIEATARRLDLDRRTVRARIAPRPPASS